MSKMRELVALGVVLLCGTALGRPGREQSSGVNAGSRLRRMRVDELEALYRAGEAEAIPAGWFKGTAILAPGSVLGRILSRGATPVWQGKWFDAGGQGVVNRFFGLRMIRAEVHEGESWIDGRPAVVLDYSRTSRVFARYRDEIRRVEPGVYLGVMYDTRPQPPRRAMFFVLERVGR